MTPGVSPPAARPGRGKGRMKEERLSREDWLDTGLRLLGAMGPAGIRVDQVCKAMAVTKGSFYWHFQDRQAFLDSIFTHWRQRETTALIHRVEETHAAPEARIWTVVEFVTLGGYDVATEVAMRQWGQSEPSVHASLKNVDAERIDFFTRQFEAVGFPHEEARRRGISAYSLILSCGYMLTGESSDALKARLRFSLDLLLDRS